MRRMFTLRVVAVLLCLPALNGLCLAQAQAQAQAPATAARAASAASDADAAMSERVRRHADNPMRIILEASKIVVRKPAAVPVALPGAAPPTPAIVRPIAAAPARAAPVPTTATAPVLTASTPPPLATLSEPAAAPTSASTPSIDTATPLLSAPVATPVAARPLATAPAAAPAIAPAVAPGVTIKADAPLKLLHMVPPDIPQNVLRRIGALDELPVQFTVQADGSVSNVVLLAARLRAVEPYVVDALKQWRYEPINAPRSQRLNLVFKAE